MISDEFVAKKREIEFREKDWSDFRGSLYRNLVEFSSIPKEFDTNPHDLILEVGAGAGRFTRKLTENRAEVIALDFSKEQLRMNKMSCGCHTVLADLCFLPFRSKVFDKTAALSVFQLIPSEKSRLSGLKEVKRVTKKRGVFLIEVYNYRPFLDSWMNKKEGFYRTSPPVYYYRFGFREFRVLLESVFQKILNFKGNLVFYPIMKASKMENSLFISKIAILIEGALQKTFFPSFFGDFIVAACET